MAKIWVTFKSLTTYTECPKKYDLLNVRKEAPPEIQSQHNALVGVVVQKVFEDFYNDEIWRMGSETLDELLKRCEVYFYEFLDTHYVNFKDFSCKYKTPFEALKDCLDMIPVAFEGIKREKLLGPYAKSEVEIKERYLNRYLFGVIDFIIQTPDGKITLLDGKTSRHREKNVDVDQLYFYALLFFLKYHKMPDRLGFYYYRFGDDPEKAFDWIPVDVAKVKDLQERILECADKVQRKWFRATPSPSSCKYCPWNEICDERLQQKREGKAIKRLKSNKNEIEVGDSDVLGFDSLK